MVEEIKRLCKENGTSIKALERELGFGNGTIRRWDDTTPSFDKVIKVAEHFRCSVEVITGEVQKEKPAPEAGNELDETLKELLEIANGVDEADRQLLLDMARSIKKRREV